VAMSASAERPVKARVLRALVVATLVVLAAQGWFGDYVAIFITPANGIARPSPTLDGFAHELQQLPSPFFPAWHAIEGIVLLLLAVAVLVLSFTWSRSRGVRIWSVVGLLSMLAAALGGYLFVNSGFGDGGSSAQMGGSFIGAFTSYFLVLYYTK
jgi:hypothetical protein